MPVLAVDEPGLVGYAREVWSYRHFVVSLVRIDLRNRYKRSAIGVGWSMLQPLAMTMVLCFAFHAIFNVELTEYMPFLMTGMAFWAFLSSAVGDGSQAFYQSQGFIKAERIPLAIYPLRVVLGLIIHLSITLGLAVALTGLLNGYTSILPLISLVPTLVLMVLFGWSIAVILAFGVVHFPDIQHLATIGLQMLFYVTPVMYPPSITEGAGALSKVLRYNPLGYFVVLLRDPIMISQFPSLTCYAITGSITAVLFAAAVFVLIHCERRLIFALV